MRRIPRIEFVEPDSELAYLRINRDDYEILDPAALARVLGNAELAAALAAMAPGVVTGVVTRIVPGIVPPA